MGLILDLEDPTGRGATNPMHHNYWACSLEPRSWNYWAHVPQLLKPEHPRARTLQQEKPLQREAQAPQPTTRGKPLQEQRCSTVKKKKKKNHRTSKNSISRRIRRCWCEYQLSPMTVWPWAGPRPSRASASSSVEWGWCWSGFVSLAGWSWGSHERKNLQELCVIWGQPQCHARVKGLLQPTP